MLFQEHYLLRVCVFDPTIVAPGVKFARRPRALVVDVSGSLLPVLETVEEIEEKMTRGF